MTPLIQWTEAGLYCKAGDFYIDPHRAVKTAIITHAHSDHARRGHNLYYCTSLSVGLMKSRLGQNISVIGIPYKEKFILGEVEISLHSAGHILGSAQVRLQKGSEVWVVSGDYKREPDPSCDPFELIPCDTFVTEATFGTPKYDWEENQNHGQDIHEWWKKNADSGSNSILFGYSLGKAQRILAELAPYANRPILIHSSISKLTRCYREEGRLLAPTLDLDSLSPSYRFHGDLILAPPSILKDNLIERVGKFETAFASGWMIDSFTGFCTASGKASGDSSRFSPTASYGASKLGYDRGFVISDHADWKGLNRTIMETGAKRVFILHRQKGALMRHLRKLGIEAYPASALTPGDYQAIVETNLSLL